MSGRKTQGFTLAELLIVVAIIAVLVAVAIPVFSNQLECAREAVDAQNLRAAYSQAKLMMMTDTASVKKLAGTDNHYRGGYDPATNTIYPLNQWQLYPHGIGKSTVSGFQNKAVEAAMFQTENYNGSGHWDGIKFSSPGMASVHGSWEGRNYILVDFYIDSGAVQVVWQYA